MAISELPHHEEMPGVYYLPLELPPATGERLKELVDSFNPSTPGDRGLMLAALLTLFWGGPCGGRPGFMFDANAAGCGKTATVDAITGIAGGAFLVTDYEEDWADVTKSLMSSPQRGTRAIVFDNVRRVMEGQAIESAITSQTISGWVLYAGNMTRPNDVTVFVTSNGGSASNDMATRLVTVKMGDLVRSGRDWVAWSQEFVRKHRDQIIADCLAVLRAPPRPEEGRLVRDRFAGWQDGVLRRIDGWAALSALIAERREGIDADSEAGEDLAEALARWCDSADAGAVSDGVVKITSYHVWKVMTGQGMWTDEKPTRNGVPDRGTLQAVMRRAKRILGRWHLLDDAKTEGGRKARMRVRLDNGDSVLFPAFTFNLGRYTEAFGKSESEQDATDIPF